MVRASCSSNSGHESALCPPPARQDPGPPLPYASPDRLVMIWNMTTPSDRTWLSAPEVVSYGDESELDQGDRLAVVRKNWSLNGDWSFGVASHVRSSTFDNIELDVRAAPALEWNYFPYSMYTRRQFRVLDEIGVSSRSYCEETLFGEFEETRAHEQLSATYEQREPWGTLEGRVEASNYFPGLSEHRFEVDGEVNVRIARGLSLNVEASASRIRDQLSLPRRDASAEEVLLRLRQLQSGFQTRVELGIESRWSWPLRRQRPGQRRAVRPPRFGAWRPALRRRESQAKR